MAFALSAPLAGGPGYARALAARRWWRALALSALLHALLMAGPGWRVPAFDELLAADPIEARLLPPPLPPSLPSSLPPVPATAVASAPARTAPTKPLRHPLPTLPPARPATSMAPGLTAPPSPAAAVVADGVGAPAVSAASPAAPAALSPPAAALPRRARLRFGIVMGGRGFVVGRAEHRWTFDGINYTLRARAETTGLAALFKPAGVVQTSEGEVIADGLRPRQFRVERGDAAGESASFDWAGARVAMSPGPRDSIAEPGMQDMLSLFWHIGLMPVSPTGMAVTVATGKKIERYVFALSGEEKIATALGERNTIHIKTLGTSGGDATEIWIDSERRLPLRIRHVDRKGEVFDQTVEEMEVE